MVWVALAVLAGGCSSGSEPATLNESPTISRDARIAMIRAARSTIEQPAADLAAAVEAVELAVEEVREDPPRRPDDRREAVQAIREGTLPPLRAAIDAAEEVELVGDSDDIEAARAAWQELIDTASEVEPAADTDLEAIERTAALDEQLAELTRRWDEPGSRRQQLERFAELAEEAEALSAEIAEAEPVAPCMTTFDRREEAARTVAERTLELRDLIQRYRGTEFDELRDEYRQDPYGFGAPITEGAADDLPCWREEGPVPTAAEEVSAALDRLQSALNPPDLS